MRTPPLLLATTLAFWGWHTDLLLLGVLAGLLLEGARLTRWRWELTQADLGRIWQLCTVLFVGVAAYLVLTTDASGATQAVQTLFQWYPLTVLPIVAAQLYSTDGRVELSILSALVRRKTAKEGRIRERTIDLSYPYFAVCALSASAAHVRTTWFYAGLCLLAAWVLWVNRSRAYSPVLWGSLLASVCLVGYIGHMGLHQLHGLFERNVMDWLSGMSGDRVDPQQSHTALGSVGRMKQSDRIILRVEPDTESQTSVLLREATYDLYANAMWFARSSRFQTLAPEADETTWKLHPGAGSQPGATIAVFFKEGRGILALPDGTVGVGRLTVGGLQHSRLGAVRVEEGPALLIYQPLIGPGGQRDGPPRKTDLTLPKNETVAISHLAGQLKLPAQQPRDALRTLTAFFQEHFRYSTYLAEQEPGSTPLSDFLFRSRAGHCEYFASATVLLLRAAGIPARYATGYSVQEFSTFEDRYLVRARHAHSWALVYIDGAWQNFDTTPASWVEIEQGRASWWGSISDTWSWVTFQVAKWRQGEGRDQVVTYLGWLVIPLAVILVWRISARTRVVRLQGQDRPVYDAVVHPGADSLFYKVETDLNACGLERASWEPLSWWIQRIQATHPTFVPPGSLDTMVALHYRYRFDPMGITREEKDALAEGVEAWLEGLRHRVPAG